MADLYRLDVLVRGNSSISQDDAVKWVKNWVNDRQESDKNKDEDGNYIHEFYSDLYDSRTNKGWKVFSDVATQNRSIANSYECEDGTSVEGVIYTLPFGELVEALALRLSFVEEQLRSDGGSQTNIQGRILA